MAILTHNGSLLLQGDGKVYSDVQNGQDGLYYRRHKEGTFYLSSKYLKDAVLSGNQITSIKESISGRVFTSGATKPILDNGIKSVSGSTVTSPNITGVGVGNFYMGEWIYIPSGTINAVFYFTLYQSTINIYVSAGGTVVCNLTSDGGNMPGGFTALRDRWIHVAVMRNGSTNYWYKDGILLGSRASNMYNYSASSAMTIFSLGTTSGMKVDDIYLQGTDSIVTPSNIIGRQDFLPPRRGGFDSNFKVF